MPRRPRRSAEGRLEINLTPLLDVVLQLITFFMMLVHFGVRLEGEAGEVRLPVAPAGLPVRDLTLDRLVVAIDAGGRLLVDDGALDGPAAEAWWAEEAARRRAGLEALRQPAGELPTEVIVRADREATYGTVRRALVAAQARGFARFAVIVLREGAP